MDRPCVGPSCTRRRRHPAPCRVRRASPRPGLCARGTLDRGYGSRWLRNNGLHGLDPHQRWRRLAACFTYLPRAVFFSFLAAGTVGAVAASETVARVLRASASAAAVTPCVMSIRMTEARVILSPGSDIFLARASMSRTRDEGSRTTV